MATKDPTLTVNRVFQKLLLAHSPKDINGNGDDAKRERMERMAQSISGMSITELQAHHAEIKEMAKSPTYNRVTVAAAAARWGMKYNALRTAISGNWYPSIVAYPQFYADMDRLLPAAARKKFLASIPRNLAA